MSIQKKYQIFVSSTFTDLIAERQSAVEAILKAGHIPAGMELFTSSNKSQWEVIKRWINESDIYMLILGGRYGSIEPESGKSYTHLEYEYAQEVGKPLFAVVVDDSLVNVRGGYIGESENSEKLAEFRKVVLSNISSFFSDSKDIKLAIHESLNDIIRENQLTGWVRGNSQNENIAEELANLSEDNRKLREENQNLKDSQIVRVPNLVVLINNGEKLEFDLIVPKEQLYIPRQPIYKIPSHLEGYLTNEEVDSYNKELDNIDDEKIQCFNIIKSQIYAMRNLINDIVINVSNLGTLKANNIFISIKFPLIVKLAYKNANFDEEIEELGKKALGIISSPLYNPLESAERKYQQDIENKFAQNLLGQRFVRNAQNISLKDNFNLPRGILSNTPDSLRDNKITIRLDNLLHDLHRSFSSYVLIPICKGEDKIKLFVHCEEYPQGQNFDIPLIVN